MTGGAGYIGSHTVFLLLEAGWEVVVVDNYVNSSPESMRRVADMTGAGDRLTSLKVSHHHDPIGGSRSILLMYMLSIPFTQLRS